MGARSATAAAVLVYDQDVAEELDKVISLRLSAEDMSALDALSKRLPLKKLTLARIALRLGLKEIERNPAALFSAPIPSEPKSEPKPKKR